MQVKQEEIHQHFLLQLMVEKEASRARSAVMVVQAAAPMVLMAVLMELTVVHRVILKEVQGREQLPASLENLPATCMRQVVAVFPMERQQGLTIPEMAAIIKKQAAQVSSSSVITDLNMRISI